MTWSLPSLSSSCLSLSVSYNYFFESVFGFFLFFSFLDLNYLCQHFNPGLHRGLAMVVPLLLCFCHNNDDNKGVTAPEKQKMLSENIM